MKQHTPFQASSNSGAPSDSSSQQSESAQSIGRTTDTQKNTAFTNQIEIPQVNLPKGGGAIRGIGEKFQVNPATGTGSISVPIAMSPGRNGFAPALALSYDSGAGNGPFGLGWSVGIPVISRKTQKGLPQYLDDIESDVFILSGTEDLVPVLEAGGHRQVRAEGDYRIYSYRPRLEGLFARIERWQHTGSRISYWRTITRDHITTFYGQTDAARLSDPDDEGRVFSWYIQRTFDDRGNVIVYEYKKEDGEQIPHVIYERNRNATQCYLKRVYYGNTQPYLAHLPDFSSADWETGNRWLFELVFDYGEHTADAHSATYMEQALWAIRPDIFSSFKPGFDVRTYRLCRRVLLFHHFEPELGRANYLVRATELVYGEDPVLSTLQSAIHRTFEWNGSSYESAAYPPVTFRYSEAEVNDELRSLPEEAYENLPQGIDHQQYQYVDLEGEGLSGILARYPDAWYYKRNLGNGVFGAKAMVPELPSLDTSPVLSAQLQDLDGSGFQDVVIHAPGINGFYGGSEEAGWQEFQAFTHNPNINWQDPNLRMIDLSGDGFADLLITQEDVFLWYPSRSKEGYDPARTVNQFPEEEQGPKLVFADTEQSIYLADMTGDGLTDLVRIHNGSICYWANKGYGKFSHKITMANAPVFDHPDRFHRQQIRLTDIDGSGTTDVLYLEHDRIRYWFNQSGNSFSEAEAITQLPATDNLSTISVIDLLGTGTACIVWSSPLPGDAYSPLRYIDLMSTGKPHLLVEINNNMGAITRMQYAPSTRFYLQDRAGGTPWITKLPFPVQVLERVETYDAVDQNHFVSRYAYHHGYFDGEEREFRGFGMVEQWDTEAFETLHANTLFEDPGRNWSEIADVAPIYTKTWFHTGCCRTGGRFSAPYESEYFPWDGEAWSLSQSNLPNDLATDEIQEAARALKGTMLRQEVYAADDGPLRELPYTITESSYAVQRLQGRGPNRHAVFFTYAEETLTYHYERNFSTTPDGGWENADPRVSHLANLAIDDFGNVTHQVTIAYPRRPEHSVSEEDQRLRILSSEKDFVHLTQDTDRYRHSLPVAARTFELNNVAFTPGQKLPIDTLRNAVLGQLQPDGTRAPVIIVPYEVHQVAGSHLRTLNHSRTTYYDEAFENRLPLGEVGFPAVPYETYTLAYTAGILAHHALGGRIDSSLLEEGGYRSGAALFGESPDDWWIPSGRQLFIHPDEPLGPEERFYLPLAIKSALGEGAALNPAAQETHLRYDPYYLQAVEVTDPLGNQMVVENIDYRVLQAQRLRDANNNIQEVAFDRRGMVIATAISGNQGEGDQLSGFSTVLADEDSEHLEAILQDPQLFLGQATSYFYYDLFAWMRFQDAGEPAMSTPNYAIALSRETHVSALPAGEDSRIQISITYTDGFGREILAKVQAEAGDAPVYEQGELVLDGNGQPLMAGTTNRWVGNGRTVFNNKGLPVHQYEPFFDSHALFTSHSALVEIGVTPTLIYDPPGRNIRTELPDGSYSRVSFSPWHVRTFDPIDTLTTENEWYQQNRQSAVTQELLDRMNFRNDGQAQRRADHWVLARQEAADKALALADTPTVQHLDTLGRPYVTIAQNRFDYRNGTSGQYFLPNHSFTDIEGNPLEIWDGRNSETILTEADAIHFNQRGQTNTSANGNLVATYVYAMNGIKLLQSSTDAGRRWNFSNVLGHPIRLWDEKGNIHRTVYDALQRPTHQWVDDGQNERLTERLYYGEEAPGLAKQNRRGQLYLHFDGAGVTIYPEYDFKGNSHRSNRILSRLPNLTVATPGIVPNWNPLATENATTALNTAGPMLEAEIFENTTSYDALNRPLEVTSPDQSITIYTYNEANFLEQVAVNLHGSGNIRTIVSNIDYNARGQRTRIQYGNGSTTRYDYDPLSFRLTRLFTTRNNGTELLQDLHYTYDPVGNISAIYDYARPVIFNNNERVEPRHNYFYDSLYQLIRAEGRESRRLPPQPPNHNETIPQPHPIPESDTEMRNYRELYTYDAAGNIREVQHIADNGNGSWTRTYHYDEPDNNRLTGQSDFPTFTFGYDEHGSMLRMPHLESLRWDHKDQLVDVNRNGDGRYFYTYDSQRQRVRKVVLEGQFREERIYLGAYELYRRYSINGADPDRELQTLHLMDDSQRVCMIETGAIGPSFTVSRFQLSNHLGSVAIETDESAEVISYEEYHPYGSTAYRSRTAQIEVGAKRYRYTGMERDEETGLTYFSHRYYADFHIKWISVDPKKEKYFGLSPYHFTGNNPVAQREVDGQDFETVVDKENKTITIRANFYTYEQDKEVAEEGAKFWNDQSGKYYLKTDKGEGEYELYRVNFELNVKVVEDTGDEETDFADAAKDPIGNIITRRFEDATNDNGKNVFSKDPNSVQLAINERNSYKASDEPLADQIRINDSVAGVYGNVGATLAHEMGHSLDLTTLNYGHTSGIMHKNKDGNTNPDTNNQLHASTVRNILYSADILPGSGALAGPKMKVMGGGDDLSFENGYVLSHDQVRRLKVSEARKSFRVAIKKIIRRRIALFFQGKKTRGERMKLKEQTKELRQERKKRIQEIRKQF